VCERRREENGERVREEGERVREEGEREEGRRRNLI
jgi:hypothetical protein